jgi:hypothetical protein
VVLFSYLGLLSRILFEPVLAGGEVFLQIREIGAAFDELVVRAKQAGDILAKIGSRVDDEILNVMGLIPTHGLARATCGRGDIAEPGVEVILVGGDLTEFAGIEFFRGFGDFAIFQQILE